MRVVHTDSLLVHLRKGWDYLNEFEWSVRRAKVRNIAVNIPVKLIEIKAIIQNNIKDDKIWNLNIKRLYAYLIEKVNYKIKNGKTVSTSPLGHSLENIDFF